MQNFKNAAKDIMKVMGLKEIGRETCAECGQEYKIYDSPKGRIGSCKPCSEKEFIKSLNLPYVEDVRRERKLRLIKHLEHIPHDLHGVTVNAYQCSNESQRKAKVMVADFIRNFDQNRHASLVLSGNPGLGKSHLACAASKAIKEQGNKVLYLKSTELLGHIRQTYNNSAQFTEEQIFDAIAEIDLLVLDDVGSEYVKRNESGHESWASDVLYKVFDIRLGKSTIVTTNYSESSLSEKYGNNGPRIISRMLDSAKAMRIEGEDFRKQKEAF